MILEKKEWFNWIEEELNRTRTVYTTDPFTMVSFYNMEKSNTKEYNGRQLLELLQNADDAAENCEKPYVLIKLEKGRLVFANNGQLFSKEGVLSLMKTGLSPKYIKAKTIGHKGLGFRSILNWGEKIRIISGTLSLEFSRSYAKSFFEKLLVDEPNIREKVSAFISETHPIATLVVPEFIDYIQKPSDYDTHIIIEFNNDEYYADIQEQIKTLGKEVLLFLNNIREIRIESPERKEILRCDHENGYKQISSLDLNNHLSYAKMWRVFSKTGNLPEKYRIGEHEKKYVYNLRMAFNENLDDNVNRLFSFFPTQVIFPFPAIVHGTFNLDNSRNHLLNDDVNVFLLGELAELMIDSAIKLKKRDDANWDALKILAKNQNAFDPNVEIMGFYKTFLDKLRKSELIPLVSKKYAAAIDGPKFYENDFANLLKYEEFSNLALTTSDPYLLDLIKVLGLDRYIVSDFVNRLNKVSEKLDIKSRASLICIIASDYTLYNYMVADCVPRLMLDQNGKIVDLTTTLNLPPLGKQFQLPDWSSLKFVNTELLDLLSAQLGLIKSRDLKSRLSFFNVDEYSLASVIRNILSSLKNKLDSDPQNTCRYIREATICIYKIFMENTAEQFPPSLAMLLLNQLGDIKSARVLYLGKDYLCGNIMYNLYNSIDPSVFIASRIDMGLGEYEEESVIKFFEWLGVAKFPRIKINTMWVDRMFKDFIINRLGKDPGYPFAIDEIIVEKSSDIKFSDIIYLNAQYIEELENILSRSQYEDILIWFCNDDSVKKIIEIGRDTSEQSKLGFRAGLQRQSRYLKLHAIPSYIYYTISNSKWIPTKSGCKAKPGICFISKTFSDRDFSPIIEIPIDATPDYYKEHYPGYSINKDDVEYLLSKLGAAKDFKELKEQQLYHILKQLPKIDPEGERAKSMYSQIIKNKDYIDIADSDYKDFLEHGLLLSTKKGVKKYRPISEVYYLENRAFSHQIIDQFATLNLERRLGAKKVNNIFGVKQLSSENINFILSEPPVFHPLNEYFEEEIEIFKPYIYVYRIEKDSKQINFSALKKLRIKLCSKLVTTCTINGKTHDGGLKNKEYVYIDNTIYFYLSDLTIRSIEDLKDDDAFCDNLADSILGILKVEELPQIRELFAKNNKKRDIMVRKDTAEENLETLNQCISLFGNAKNVRLEFWSVLIKVSFNKDGLIMFADEKSLYEKLFQTFPDCSDLIRESLENINYEEYCDPYNLPYFVVLFQKLDIDINTFNDQSQKSIDFKHYYFTRWDSYKNMKLNDFKRLLYQNLFNADVSKQEDFLFLINKYEQNEDIYFRELEIDFNLENIYKNFIIKNFNSYISDQCCKNDLDLNLLYTNHEETFRQSLLSKNLLDKDIFTKLLLNAKYRSLMYFGRYESLSQIYIGLLSESRPSDKCGELSTQNTSKSYSDISESDSGCLKQLEILDRVLKNNTSSQEPPKSHHHNNAINKHESKKLREDNEQTGRRGEKLIYESLVEIHGKEKVHWVSENARLEGINPEGDDNKSYDIDYIDKENETQYIEVKSSKNYMDKFSITRFEVDFGLKHKENYHVILIHNIGCEDRKVERILKIFSFELGQTFTYNTKFDVVNESFTIRLPK